MALSNCKRCGSVFSRVNRPICPDCIKKEDAMLDQATQWVRENPGRTINAMSEDTGIEKRLILQWVRQKLITLSEKTDGLVCKRCGEEVSSGTLCDRCKLVLSHDVGRGIKAIKESKPSSPEQENKGMHYHRSDKDRKARL